MMSRSHVVRSLQELGGSIDQINDDDSSPFSGTVVRGGIEETTQLLEHASLSPDARRLITQTRHDLLALLGALTSRIEDGVDLDLSDIRAQVIDDLELAALELGKRPAS